MSAPPSGSRSGFAALLGAEAAARAAAAGAERWLTSLTREASEATTQDALDALVANALGAISIAMRADAASVLLADEAATALVLRLSVGLGRPVERDVRIPAGMGVAGKILSSGQPMLVDDLLGQVVESLTLRESGLRSLVGVPLRSGDRVVGVMHATSREPKWFTEEDLQVLALLGEPLGAAIGRVRLIEAERAAREEAERTAERLRGLQRITSVLVGVTRLGEVCEAVLDEAAAGVAGAPERAIWLLQEGRLVLLAGGDLSQDYSEIPLDDTLPARENLESGAPLFVENREEMLARWPALAQSATRAFAALPLMIDTRRIGVFAVAFRDDHRFDVDERAYLTAIAEQAAVAIDRTRLRAAEREATRRRALVADATIALAESDRVARQLECFLDVVVPRFADCCAVLLRTGGEFQEVAARHSSQGCLLAGDGGDYGVPPDLFRGRPGSPRVTVLVAPSPAPTASDSGGSRYSTVYARFLAPGAVAGVLVFETKRDPRGLSPGDIEVAEALAERVGVALERQHSADELARLVEALSRAILPGHFPQLRGIEFAARYEPADRGSVGGDWFDVFQLRDGRLTLVVGDVSGHGVDAAAAMARLKHGLYAFAKEGRSPEATLPSLPPLLPSPEAGDESHLLATLLTATIEPTSMRMVVANAGHPPWLRLRDGVASFGAIGGRALATGFPPRVLIEEERLEAGDILVLYTDGLVERPGEMLDEGFARLVAIASRLDSTADLQAFCDRLVAEATDFEARRDDCCALVLRVAR